MTRAHSACPDLNTLAVYATEMVRLDETSKVFPEYCVVDGKTGKVFRRHTVLSGEENELMPTVCLYRCSNYCEGKHADIVLKSIVYNDASDEHLLVEAVDFGSGLVPARVAQLAVELKPGEHLGPRHFYVVLMQYGGTELTVRNNLTLRATLDIVLQVCHHLRELLAHNLVYTDLKPSNILITEEGKAVLCDYGGLAVLGTTSGTATYPPSGAPRGLDVPASEATMLYGLGILMVCLSFCKLERELRYVTASVEPNIDLAQLKLSAAASCIQARVTCLTHKGGEVLATAWRPGTTLEQFGETLSRALEEEKKIEGI